MAEEAYDIMMSNPISRAQKEVADKLRADPYLRQFNVEILEENTQALSMMLAKGMADAMGVTLVVGTDGITNNPPVYEVKITLHAWEFVQMNRANAKHITAIDAIMRAVDLIDGGDWCMQEVRHDSPSDGVLSCAATFQGQMWRTVEGKPADIEPRERPDD